ncbi:hypothetical protein HMN09_00284000 [Mycena chlorophos]|uniref:Uncharacterized protein n=1 Tax=Mycena chlorophos TaxID=658473 RepID=A0A8H6TKX3_MYCCL|nr:hypothetical protein HMN09_00284000 [Mycena chlorophos]
MRTFVSLTRAVQVLVPLRISSPSRDCVQVRRALSLPQPPLPLQVCGLGHSLFQFDSSNTIHTPPDFRFWPAQRHSPIRESTVCRHRARTPSRPRPMIPSSLGAAQCDPARGYHCCVKIRSIITSEILRMTSHQDLARRSGSLWAPPLPLRTFKTETGVFLNFAERVVSTLCRKRFTLLRTWKAISLGAAFASSDSNPKSYCVDYVVSAGGLDLAAMLASRAEFQLVSAFCGTAFIKIDSRRAAMCRGRCRNLIRILRNGFRRVHPHCSTLRPSSEPHLIFAERSSSSTRRQRSAARLAVFSRLLPHPH